MRELNYTNFAITVREIIERYNYDFENYAAAFSVEYKSKTYNVCVVAQNNLFCLFISSEFYDIKPFAGFLDGRRHVSLMRKYFEEMNDEIEALK